MGEGRGAVSATVLRAAAQQQSWQQCLMPMSLLIAAYHLPGEMVNSVPRKSSEGRASTLLTSPTQTSPPQGRPL